ncbi:hypothetical protein HS088_TW21G00443 [Tripterygium wilfordii]|uniref:Membrane-associated kinase regulator 1 n=1 Tax=Tripterygium wilfordii TaxID=458696 RepID=A0A7J7C3F9_TRIWF|nr:uncharacterized protein LOC119987722 [Tripterygium wilfordii]KAF5728296.1 hypothetical protein HS088_TW21G00443 [Tripterygium wilfordii]
METPMESHRRQRTRSGEAFSFPNIPIQDPDFEFESLTPDSTSSIDQYKTNSPADHLFSNGLLLPHTYNFPSELPTPTMLHISSTSSRTSSVNSKDSLLSSKSNSTNSSRSSFSARTSSSDDNNPRVASRTSSVSCHVYGASQRWQIIAPVLPVLNRDSSRKRSKNGANEGTRGKKQENEKSKEVKPGIWRRFFRYFLVACRQCHALEPSSVKDDDDVL